MDERAEEIINKAEEMRVEEMRMPEDPIERRIFRLEIYERNNTKDISELQDRTKSAHHRIDETQRDLQEFRKETATNFANLNTKLDNIGINMAKNADANDKKWKKVFVVMIVVAILALAAFAGTFAESSETRKTVGEIAGKVATVTATVAPAVL